MAGPWEDFQSSSATADEAPPWEDYKKKSEVVARTTGYYPTPASSPAHKMEGGYEDRKGGPVHTLDAYLRGDAPYVTVAGDPRIPYGTPLRSPDFPGIPFRVNDTGSAFKGAGTSHFDIARDTAAGANSQVNNRPARFEAGDVAPWEEFTAKAPAATPAATPDKIDFEPENKKSITRNAIDAAVETGKEFVKSTLTPRGIAGLVSPLSGAYEDVKKAAEVASGVPYTEAVPESQIIPAAEQTAPGSKERFKAGFGELANVAMLVAGGRGLLKPKAEETPLRPAEEARATTPPWEDFTPKTETATAPPWEDFTPQPEPAPAFAPEGGGIPIEGLPAEAPAPTAAEPPAEIPFRDHPDIPAATKIRWDDAAQTAGLDEEQIASLTPTDAAAIEAQQWRATNLQGGGEQPDASQITSPESVPTPEASPQAPLTPEQQAEADFRAEQVAQYDEANRGGGGQELLAAIRENGGMPSHRGSEEQTSGYRGELRNLYENTTGKSKLTLFRKDADPIDRLTSYLRAQGFDFETPNDLLAAVEYRLRGGRAIYSNPPENVRVFASGTSAPRLRSGEKQGDLLSTQQEDFKLVGEKGVDYTARQLEADAAAAAKAKAAAEQEGQQGKLFASGTSAQPHAPAPRLPPSPAPPPTPVVAASAAPVRSWWQQRTLGMRKLVAPQTIDAPARMTANIIRDYNGQLANKIIQADHALSKARADFDRTPVPSSWKYDPAQPLPRNYAFMAEAEKGGANLSASDRALKTQMDGMFAEAVDEVHRVKPAALKSLIQDYFPHIWKDPEAARQAFASIVGTRPLEGSKGFLKQRTLDHIADGLKLGLKPISDNPIDMVLTKLHEVHKFVAAQDMLTEAKAIGARKFVYIFEKAPEGWVKVDDPTSTVHGPPFVKVAEAFDEQMKVKTIELLDRLGVPHERVMKLGGTRWGTAAAAGTPPGRIRTKFGGPLSVYWHELGHVLEFRYKWLDTVLHGERAGGQSPIAKELRALADLRGEGQANPKSFQKYIRNRDEKAAVLLEAYMHAPQKMQQVAPLAYGRVKKFIDAHPELSPINDIRPSLVLGSAKGQVPVGGMVTLGSYYMPEGAAQVFNNYLSPGLQRYGIIRNIRQSTNILSGMQLGFSAFHAGFTSIDAAVSQFALALRYASEGKIGKALEKTLTVPAAPVTNYLTGLKVQRAMVDPGSQTPHIENIAQLAVQAGLRATVDPFWKTQITRNMMRAWHEGGVKGYAGTILRAPFAASEQMMRPILEYLVPRQKLGVFAGMAQQHMERLGPNADVHAVRDAMARAADATEDRMGQMTYDNLFYNRVIRDTALMGFRAYGWTFGKYRALFGGVSDTLGTVGRVKAGGPVLTDRMAYLLALPMVVAGIGSVMNYTMTGQAPQDWKDALMPRTGKLDRNGNPERLSLPTYIKDILSDWHDFPNTKKVLTSFGHKLNPWLSIAQDVINNADFFNTKVFNEDDPFWKQQMDKLRFIAGSAKPFTVTSTAKLQESHPTMMQQVLPFFGFVPAKAALSITPAQIRAAELMHDSLPQGSRTQEQANHSKLVSTLMRDMKEADPNYQQNISAALGNGQLRPEELSRMISQLPLNPLQYQVKKLPAEQAMKVWDLSNPEERTKLRSLLVEKLANSKTLTPEDRIRYFHVLNADKGANP